MAAELKAARLEQAAAAYQAALKRKAVVMAAVQQVGAGLGLQQALQAALASSLRMGGA